MNAIDYVILAAVILIVVGALWYIRRAKKRGVMCIGCPEGVKCAGHCSGCSGNCCGQGKEK
jgi:hypothetical protein